MLKKLALGGAALAAVSVGLAAPAAASVDIVNVASQNGNTTVCGNQAIGDILIPVIPLTPVTSADREPLDCGTHVRQSR